jgi:hypothetical protein
MPEIGMSGSMSGVGKRGLLATAPNLDSTDRYALRSAPDHLSVGGFCALCAEAILSSWQLVSVKLLVVAHCYPRLSYQLSHFFKEFDLWFNLCNINDFQFGCIYHRGKGFARLLAQI